MPNCVLFIYSRFSFHTCQWDGPLFQQYFTLGPIQVNGKKHSYDFYANTIYGQ